MFKELPYIAPAAGCYFRVLMLLVHCFPPPQRFSKGSCYCYCLSLEAMSYFQCVLISRGLVSCLSWNERGCVRPVQVLLNERSRKSQPLLAASLPKESILLVSILLYLYVLVSGLNNYHSVNTRHCMESV